MNQVDDLQQRLIAMQHEKDLSHQQAKKYAEDITAIYRQERKAKEELILAHQQLKKYAGDLSATVTRLKTSNRELQESYLDTIRRLVLAAEYKDEDTGEHIARMSRYSALIAGKAGMPNRDVENILFAAPMHDVGKIGIPDEILMKPGKLTTEEWEIMKTHCAIGARILAGSKSQVIQMAQQIAISHHEKWDGTGYPQGLTGDAIPLPGRIVAVADVFDALTSKRPYKEPFSIERSIEIIKEERERHFDPALVDLFMDNLDGILEIKKESAESG